MSAAVKNKQNMKIWRVKEERWERERENDDN